VLGSPVFKHVRISRADPPQSEHHHQKVELHPKGEHHHHHPFYLDLFAPYTSRDSWMVENVTMDGLPVIGTTIDSEVLLQRGRHGLLRFRMSGEPTDDVSSGMDASSGMEARLWSIHNTPTSILQSRQDLQLVDFSSFSSIESLNKTVTTLRKQLLYYKSLAGR
jgi:hypothetical protein